MSVDLEALQNSDRQPAQTCCGYVLASVSKQQPAGDSVFTETTEYVIRRQTLGELADLVAGDSGAAEQQQQQRAPAADHGKPQSGEHGRRHSGSGSTVRTEFSRHFEFDDEEPDSALQVSA